jgi:hypothetical protein
MSAKKFAWRARATATNKGKHGQSAELANPIFHDQIVSAAKRKAPVMMDHGRGIPRIAHGRMRGLASLSEHKDQLLAQPGGCLLGTADPRAGQLENPQTRRSA